MQVAALLIAAAGFTGSSVSVSTYLGTGTFVADEYSDNPYVSQAFAVAPRYGFDHDLSLTGRFSVECEYTEPDSSTGRHCAPSDTQLGLAWTPENAQLAFTIIAPTSFESQFANTIVNLRLSGGYTFAFFDNRLTIGLNAVAQKYLPSRKIRGFTNGEPTFFPIRAATPIDGAVGTGGPMNNNWMFLGSTSVGFKFTDELSASIGLSVFTVLRFAVDESFADPNLPGTGRADFTSGNISISYVLPAGFSLTAGIESTQPALTADNKSVRFPFYDFVSPTNNFTRWFLSAAYRY